MAALSTTNPNLLDLAKRLGPDNKIATIVELLNSTNEVLDDAVWIEGNQVTGHLTTIRTGLPTPTWRKFNAGVQPSKSKTAQITAVFGNMEAYAEVDKGLADLNNNTAEFRLSEDRPHIEGMSQEFADTLFHGTAANPEEFIGFNAYYNSLSAANAENIIVGGGSGTDNGSIWLIGWGENTVHCGYPKGSTVGLQHTDKGQVTIENADGSGGRMEAYRTHYKMAAGLVVRDWRYAVRIPNIDKSALLVTAATGADLPDLMFQAIDKLPSLDGVKPVFYMSRTMRSMFRRQSADKTKNSTLTIENVGGKMLMAFHGIPVRRTDVLAADESAVA